MGRGYSGNHPRFSKRGDERYDAKEAYNKDLTASARLHYLENDRHDHDSPANSHCSPMHRHNDRHIKKEAKQIARKNEGDEQDIYYELKAKIDDERSKGAAIEGRNIGKFLSKNDERSGEERRKDIDEMIYERPDSPMNEISKRGERILNQADKARDAYYEGNIKKGDRHAGRARRIKKRDDKGHARANQSPMNACAKSEGGSGCVKQMGGAWRVISNKTDKPWPAKYANKAKAEAALRGYHAG